MRKLIKEYFHQRTCYTFVQPSSDESTLQNLNKLPLESLRKEFQEKVHVFRRELFERIKVKRIMDRPISGSGLATMLASWVEAINEGSIPDIENSFEQVAL